MVWRKKHRGIVVIGATTTKKGIAALGENSGRKDPRGTCLSRSSHNRSRWGGKRRGGGGISPCSEGGKFAFSFTKIVNFPPKVNSGTNEKNTEGSVFISVRREERRDAS